MRTAKSCGPDTSVVGVKSVAATPPMTVSTKPDHRGERDISRKPLRGECRVKPVRPDERVCVLSPPLHTRLAGASSARYSPRPLFRGSRTNSKPRAKNLLRDRETVSTRHVWTAPSRQGLFGVSANGSGSGHVYGLEKRSLTAGPDGDRRSNSNHCGALCRAMP